MVTKAQVSVFQRSAERIYLDKDYTSATILYFKTWFALQDSQGEDGHLSKGP
ncbi:hypothetical protein HYV84_08055 [Candidatus Woesearchaeota archaeon]|nr:hypothetical protein [Candidatus Woesearchaeota archaeon]